MTGVQTCALPIWKFEDGKVISGLQEAEDTAGVKVLHAGTKRVGDSIVTAGGRVLGVTASAPSLEEALDKAYRGAENIHFDGMHYRRDIGQNKQSSAAKE